MKSQITTIDPASIYCSKELRRRLGKTLYARYLHNSPPSVRGVHLGASVLEALKEIEANALAKKPLASFVVAPARVKNHQQKGKPKDERFNALEALRMRLNGCSD